MEKYFDHEKLDVYRAAIGFVVLVDEIILKNAVEHECQAQSFDPQRFIRKGPYTDWVCDLF